ncbi:MAG: DUF6504 family protein [Actinomycetia bacterium]|nr:DUF6504 family protein [Actinomycetes bacterium]
MRSYAESIIAHPDPAPHNHTVDCDLGHQGESPPKAFLWRGRHYSVRTVVSTWLDQAPWWRGSSQPVRRCWRVEASAGLASGVGVLDLFCDADGTWHLMAVHD